MTQFFAQGTMARQLVDAAASNHISWFAANAAASGGETHRAPGVIWTVTDTEAILTFPRLEEGDANAVLDSIVRSCREQQLERIGCWFVSPSQPQDLGARLAAHGFEWGWRPHWMALDLSALRPPLPLPSGVVVTRDGTCDWDVDDLPYYSRQDAARFSALTRTEPRHTWHFVARLDGVVVGHSTLHLTTGEEGVAGIYNVGVVPGARHLGIGSAVSWAACQFAQELGCTYALLNSAADGLYLRLGFQSLGYGQTWWMHTPTLRAAPPTPGQIAFAEALGRGDIQALSAMSFSDLTGDLEDPLPNGMTPMALAVHAQNSASARWLMARGVALDLLEAWDLQWETDARQMLAANPSLVNRRAGNWQLTPLHEAVQRDDLALVRFLLEAQADVTIEDAQFHATPLGWAKHLQRSTIADLLQHYQRSR